MSGKINKDEFGYYLQEDSDLVMKDEDFRKFLAYGEVKDVDNLNAFDVTDLHVQYLLMIEAKDTPWRS